MPMITAAQMGMYPEAGVAATYIPEETSVTK